MHLKLRGDYSPSEWAMLKTLAVNRHPLTSRDLAKNVYRGRERPLFWREVMSNGVRSLARKLAHYRERYRLKRTRITGSRTLEIRLVQK
jgi:hypothetical protein